MTSPKDQIATFPTPVWRLPWRDPIGQPLLLSEGRIGASPVHITVTTAEIHIRLVDAGDAFAVDLQAVCQAAFAAVEAHVARGRR